MGFVKKCKRVLGSSKRLDQEDSGSTSSCSYDKLSQNSHKKQKDSSNNKKVPHGCVCVYVGIERQRFIIKIKIFNHPLFKTLLEGVEDEYGYRNDGPLWLPCDVDFFCEALAEIESVDNDIGFGGCKFPIGHKHSSVSNSSIVSCRSNYMSSDANYQLLV